MTGTRDARIMAGTQGTWEFPWFPSRPPGKCRGSGATTINVVTTSFQIISNSPFILQFEAEVSSKLLTASSNEDSPRGIQILQKSRTHVHILSLKMLSGRMVHTEDPKIFRDDVQKMSPGRPGFWEFTHPCTKYRKLFIFLHKPTHAHLCKVFTS